MTLKWPRLLHPSRIIAYFTLGIGAILIVLQKHELSFLLILCGLQFVQFADNEEFRRELKEAVL